MNTKSLFSVLVIVETLDWIWPTGLVNQFRDLTKNEF